MTLDIDAIKARADAATEGPWVVDDQKYVLRSKNGGWDGLIIATVQHDDFGLVEEDNTAFIASARQDIPALLAEVERLQAIVERVRELHVSGIGHNPNCHCGIPAGDGALCRACGEINPCPTVRALEDL